MWAVHQYMYWHVILDDLGYDPLAKLFKQIAIGEMIHVEKFAERILFLGGEVEMKAAQEVEKIKDVRGILQKGMEMEQGAVHDYNKYALECAANADSASKAIFEDLVMDEEGHADAFETQLDHLDKFGEQFLALQSIDRSRAIAEGGGEAHQH
jgi:bacterioferritin